MSSLLVATRNRGKQAEFRVLLQGIGRELLFPDDIGLAPSVAEDGLELFNTFEANAHAKAEWFAAQTGLPTLADDSGVEVDALGGAPGVRSRRFAGIDGPDHEVADANNAELLRRLAGVVDSARAARYRGVLVLCEPASVGRMSRLSTDGVTEGRILQSPRGRNGFGYDPLFWSDEIGASFGEITQMVKDSVSHRARAVAALAGRLRVR